MSIALATAMVVGLPLMAAAVAFAHPRRGRMATLGTGLLLLPVLAVLVLENLRTGPWRQDLGGWAAPLGIGWQIDALALTLLVLTTVVALAAAIYRLAERRLVPDSRQRRYFWPLWLFLWGGLNALFLSADLFNLYVILEMVALAAVALIAAAGGPALAAAWRYFLATLLGSTLYLLGVALLYGQYGALDIVLLTGRAAEEPVTLAAAVMITLGLLLKGAIFPLHFWLPSAHGRAHAAVSAVLSAVVVTAAFYLLVRLWFGPFAGMLPGLPAQLLGLLGAAAVIWGGVLAMLQRHLKMVIAYSTVSQLGFGLLVFPLATAGALPDQAHAGMLMLLLAHGLAKGSLFLAAGCLAWQWGSDHLRRIGPPMAGGSLLAWIAIALAAASLVGLPPSGGFVAKWWLLESALAARAWPWAAVIVLGTFITAGYLWRILRDPLRAGSVDAAAVPARAQPLPIPLAMPRAALLLALAAIASGLFATALRSAFEAGGLAA
ncbi:complex I subunit 5 family protein [Thioalkalivibrio sp. AKL17]|uniref:complex I subunit 5 family protein n=1 Tax=Thioalkalivibrio sp. AKL17 TaxID=1158160 RepID=UPI00037ECA13|nr:proton-conducting transporter membrane subunit [Thioalkalivibrio sp. AKL17]